MSVAEACEGTGRSAEQLQVHVTRPQLESERGNGQAPRGWGVFDQVGTQFERPRLRTRTGEPRAPSSTGSENLAR